MATLTMLAAWVDAQIISPVAEAEKDSDVIEDIRDLATATPKHISFLSHPRQLPLLYQTQAAAVLVNQVIADAPCVQLVCADPYLAMAKIAQKLNPRVDFEPGIHPQAWVHPQAKVDTTAYVGAFAVVEAHAQVGVHSYLGAQCYVGEHAMIGAHCWLYPAVKIMHHCRLANHVMIHSGAVIGGDGFGYAVDKATGERIKILQRGVVVLEDHVEIGNNSTIDRATFGETRIGAGCKIDNLVQIGHNVELGCDCVVVSQSGIAGSTVLGDRVILGAQGGMSGHLHVVSDVVLAGRSGVTRPIKTAGVYAGFPAVPHRDWLKQTSSQRRVPDLLADVKKLTHTVNQLTQPDSSLDTHHVS